MINYFKLRLRRLNLVCKPDYGTTTGKKKQFLKKENREVEYEYDMTKIYWFDDSGKRIRKINKNFGRRDVIEFEKQFGDYLLNNIKGLENSIKNILKKDIKIMGQKSNKLYHQKFSEKIVYSEIENLYKSILQL
jgi:hypothetical protein